MRPSEPTMTLRDFIAGEKKDRNLFWRMDSGDHQNLLDEAIEAARELRAIVRETQHQLGHHKRTSCNCTACTTLTRTAYLDASVPVEGVDTNG